jgi:hypothetical protein
MMGDEAEALRPMQNAATEPAAYLTTLRGSDPGRSGRPLRAHPQRRALWAGIERLGVEARLALVLGARPT